MPDSSTLSFLGQTSLGAERTDRCRRLGEHTTLPVFPGAAPRPHRPGPPPPPAPHRPFPAASTAAASTTSPQHTDSPPRTLTPADAADGRARWPTAEPAAGSSDQWAAGGRGFFSPKASSPADMRAKVCQDGDSLRQALWDL